jgi:hypothetical protein
MRDKYWFITFFLGAFAFIGIVFVYDQNFISLNNEEIDIPENVGEYNLVSILRGNDAIESTKDLHVGSVDEINDAVIATYMNQVSRRMYLWISSFESSDYSENIIERMVDAMIRQPEFGFNPRNHTVNGLIMYITEREDSVDIFWVEDKIVSYFSISNSSVENSLRLVNIYINEN